MGEFRKEALPASRDYLESEGLKIQGRGKWITTECRLHGGSDSLRWNLETGGWICMSCGQKGGDVLSYHMKAHGMEFADAARALGAWDESVATGAPQKPKPLPATAALEVLSFESLLVAVAACNAARGVEITQVDKDRLLVAARRIGTIQEAYK